MNANPDSAWDEEPGNLECHGSAELVVPAVRLLSHFNDRFASQAWRLALSQPRSIDTERLLRTHGLGEHEPGPEDYCHTLRRRSVGQPKTEQDLKRLLGLAAELQQGDPARTGEAYAQLVTQWATLFRRRFVDAVADAINAGGTAAASEALRLVQGRVEGWLEKARRGANATDTPQAQSELSEAFESLHAAQRDGTLTRRVARRIHHDPPLAVTRSSTRRTQISKLAKVIDGAVGRRHERSIHEACVPILEKLLGDGGLFASLQQQVEEAESLVDAFRVDSPPQLQAAGPEEVLLVTGLDDPCGPNDATYGDLLNLGASQAGCTPKRLADRLWNKGLKVGGRRLKPPQWRTDDLPQLYSALQKETAAYLSLDDLDRPVRIDQPKTAADYFATLGLLHPALRERLRSVLPELVRQARPHLDVSNAPRVRQNAYLHCRPGDRATWEELLSNHVAVGPAPNGQADLSHPMRVVLTISVFGVNAHRLPQLREGLHQAALSETSDAPVLRHEHAAGELRLLDERPEEPEEYRQLLRACVAGGVVRPLAEGQDRLMLARSEPSIRRYFFAAEIEPLEQSARYFHQMLRDDRFVRFVEIHQPGIEGWAAIARRQAEAPTPIDAANELTRRGVLQRKTGGGFVMAGPPPASLRHAPHGLYRTRFGDAVGLSKEQFVAALRDDQRFLSVVAWHALDAWIDGRLTGEDLPPFVRELRKRLESD